MGVGLLQVLAGAGDVEGYSHHLDPQFFGCLQQVPAALQRRTKGHAGLSRVCLSGQLQQQPIGDKRTTKYMTKKLNKMYNSEIVLHLDQVSLNF